MSFLWVDDNQTFLIKEDVFDKDGNIKYFCKWRGNEMKKKDCIILSEITFKTLSKISFLIDLKTNQIYEILIRMNKEEYCQTMNNIL